MTIIFYSTIFLYPLSDTVCYQIFKIIYVCTTVCFVDCLKLLEADKEKRPSQQSVPLTANNVPAVAATLQDSSSIPSDRVVPAATTVSSSHG